jgi:DNA-directed RNA polymerase subunit omega
MARVTIEDCLKEIDNTFDICSLASKRAKDIASGVVEPMLDCKDKPAVIALREIAEKKINMDYFDISNAEVSESQLPKGISEEEIIEELGQQLDETSDNRSAATDEETDAPITASPVTTDEETDAPITASPVTTDDQSPNTDEETNTHINIKPE